MFERNYNIITGEIAGNAIVGRQLPDISCCYVKFKAARANAGNVYLGVTDAIRAVQGITSTVTGFELDAGEETDWLPIENLKELYIVSTNAADDLVYMALI